MPLPDRASSIFSNLETVNEMIVKASHDTGACYEVTKCAEVVFERGKMVKGKGLDVLDERMNALDPDANEIYRFLGCEQADKVDKGKVMERVMKEVVMRMRSITQLELYNKNLVRAVNCKAIPVTGCVMNACRLSKEDLDELDMTVKRELRERNMHGRQGSDERLYLARAKGGRGVKSMRGMYKETKVRVACCMSLSRCRWIKVAWKREQGNEYCSIKRETEEVLEIAGEEVSFGIGDIDLNGEKIYGSWKDAWRKLKILLKSKMEKRRVYQYQEKKLQSEVFSGQEEKCNQWLDCNLDWRKTAAIIEMLEQMVGTKVWKALRGMEVESEICRPCADKRETVHHLLVSCKVLAGNEYVRRHNSALMVLAVEWGKETGLFE